MDPDDRHYYCCGECHGLFKTLSNLSRHKKLCTGAKDLNSGDGYFAYHCSYLLKLLECCTSCKHTEQCPILTIGADERPERKRRGGVKLKLPPKDHVQKKQKQWNSSLANSSNENSKECPNLTAQVETVPSEKTPMVHKTNVRNEKCIQGDGADVTPETESINVTPLKLENDEISFSTADDEVVSSGEYQSKGIGNDASDVTTNLHEAMKKYVHNSETNDGTSRSTYWCPVCDWTSFHIGFFARHLGTHTGTGEQASSWQCRKCDYTCTDPSDLKAHIATNHPNKTPKDVSISNKRSAAVASSGNDSLKKYTVSESTNGGKSKTYYKCTVCGWKTIHVGFFIRHLRTHNGTDANCKWTCSQCDFECVNTSELKLHSKKHKKSFMCEYCSRRFGTKQELNRHVHLHTGEKPYKCSQCDYRCRQSKNLIEHRRKHTGEKLKCQFEGCTFTTYYKWALKAHFGSKHSTIKRFSCTECTYQTSDSSSMVRHKRLHAGEKNYKCSQCNFRAVAKHDIVKHMRTHTKEKVYFCDQCNFGTSHSSCLRLHIMNHLGIKPWQCVLCGYNSLTRGKVLRHLKQTHQSHISTSINDAVVNLGLKLDINVSEYRRNKDTGDQIIYDVQEVPDFDHLAEGGVIVHEVTEEDMETTPDRPESTKTKLTQLNTIHFQQLSSNNLEDVIIPQEGQTIIIPMSVNEDELDIQELSPGAKTIDSCNEITVVSQDGQVPHQGTVYLSAEHVKLVQDQMVFVSEESDLQATDPDVENDGTVAHTVTLGDFTETSETILPGQSGLVLSSDRSAANTHKAVIYTGDLGGETVFLGQDVKVVVHLEGQKS